MFSLQESAFPDCTCALMPSTAPKLSPEESPSSFCKAWQCPAYSANLPGEVLQALPRKALPVAALFPGFADFFRGGQNRVTADQGFGIELIESLHMGRRTPHHYQGHVHVSLESGRDQVVSNAIVKLFGWMSKAHLIQVSVISGRFRNLLVCRLHFYNAGRLFGVRRSGPHVGN